MKVLIYGVGGVGGFIGSFLEKTDLEVSYIARGKRCEFLKNKGLILNSQIEYNLHTIGRIRPFLGIGLTYGTSTLNNIEYRFEGPDGRIEVYLPDLDPQSFWLAGINIGCDINLLERLDLRANFNSRLRLRGFKHKGLYSFNTGFNYHL